jgi:hypothetical protein
MVCGEMRRGSHSVTTTALHFNSDLRDEENDKEVMAERLQD